MGGGPFLQRGFGMPGRLKLPGRAVAPGAADKGLRGVEALFDIERADQRLHDVAQHIVALHRAVVAGLLAQAHIGGDADIPADGGTGLAADDRVESAREIALGLVGEQFVKPGPCDQAEHPVAQEFEPLIMVRAVAAMGQRALEQGEVAGAVAERVRYPGAQGIFVHRGPLAD